MKWTIVPPALMAVGLVLMIAGFVWPRVIGNAVWSEEQAQRRSQAGSDVHRLQYEHAFAAERENKSGENDRPFLDQFGDDPVPSADRVKAELDQAHEDWTQSDNELKWARTQRNLGAAVLWWLGVVSCLLGVVGYFVLRMEWAQQYIEA